MTTEIDPRDLAQARVHMFNALEQLQLIKHCLKDREDLHAHAKDLQNRARTLRTVLDMQSIKLTPLIPPSERKDRNDDIDRPTEPEPKPSAN